MHIAICDDIAGDRQALRLALLRELDGRGITATCSEYGSGEALLRAWDTAPPVQLLFLDIYMPGLNGMETAQRLRARNCQAAIVFLTTTPDFAMDGYEVDAVGYLLKPLDQKKLGRLLDKLSMRDDPAPLTLRSGTSVFTIVPTDILYIESNRNRLTIHTVKESIPYYGKLDELARQLPSKPFLRCHQSFLINMDRVYSVADDFHMENGAAVPIRVRERKAIRETYFRYITGVDA